MKSKIFFLILVCVSQVACQSLQVTLPGPSIESPVVPGKTADFDFENGFRPATAVKVTENAGERPFVPDDPKVNKSLEYFAKGLMGIATQFEVSVGFGVPGSFTASFKYQFTGNPRSDRKEGDYLGAVYATIGSGMASQNGNQAYAFGPGGFPWKASVTGSALGLGASFGYQAGSWFLVYAGLSHFNYSLKYTVDQEAAGSYAETHYSSGTQEGSADALGIGFEYGKSVMIGATGQYTMRYWVANQMLQTADGSLYLKFLF